MSWFAIITGLLGGLALFLYGLDQLTRRLSTVAGEGLRTILAKLTSNRFSAMGAGAVVTAIIQSSSVTTVLLVGFVSAGLLTIQQSIGVIIGANIGTTVTAQIIAFKVTEYAMLLVAAGFFTQMILRSPRARDIGLLVMGLGLVFLGMNLMSDATNPLRTWQPFLDFMQAMRNPILGALTGALFTALIQSSSATTGIIIVFASQGLIPLQAGIAIILGANVGTCVTAMLATIGKPRTATQVALVHLIFNVTGVIVALIVMQPFARLIQSVSPVGDTAREIANAHTIFNIANAIVFIGFTGPLAKLVQRIAPLKPTPPRVEPKYLEKALLDVPAGALDAARREIGRLGEQIVRIVRMIPTIMSARSAHEVEVLADMDEDADTLHVAIIAYLGQIATRDISSKHASRIQDFIEIANDLDHVSDTIEKEMAAELREQLARHIPMLTPGAKLKELIDHATWMVEAAVASVTATEGSIARQVIEAKAKAQDLVRDARNELTRELRTADVRTVQSVRHGFDYVGHLNYLTYLARRVAKAVQRGKGTDAPNAETKEDKVQ